MDWNHFFTLLFSTDMPRLPDLDVLRWSRRLSWCLVLLALWLVLARRWPRRVQLGGAALALGTVLLKGPWSPSFWLGLAFQSPSLMTAVLLAWLSWRRLYRADPDPSEAMPMPALWRLSLWGLVLGWVLLLDTFVFWPMSIYAWGFSPAAVLAIALLAVISWLVWPGKNTGGVFLILLGGVLLLYVVLRLPSGNVWDALLDPWLWGAIQVAWLVRGFKMIRWRLPLKT